MNDNFDTFKESAGGPKIYVLWFFKTNRKKLAIESRFAGNNFNSVQLFINKLLFSRKSEEHERPKTSFFARGVVKVAENLSFAVTQFANSIQIAKFAVDLDHESDTISSKSLLLLPELFIKYSS